MNKWYRCCREATLATFNCKGTFTQSYLWRPQVAETLTLHAHK